jgi:hypothetical protein
LISIIAANSFFVSIKSSSIENVTFDKHEVQWLANLELPFFIASVNKKDATIELFCAHHLYNAFATNSNRESITLHFTAPPKDQDFVPKDNNNVLIGPCIMKWSLDTLNNEPDFQSKFFNIVKSHIDIARNSIQTYSIGFIEDFVWKTNEPLVKGLYKTICADDDPIKGFEDVDDKMAPYFSMWIDKILRSKNFGRLDETISVLQEVKLVMELLNNTKK